MEQPTCYERLKAAIEQGPTQSTLQTMQGVLAELDREERLPAGEIRALLKELEYQYEESQRAYWTMRDLLFARIDSTQGVDVVVVDDDEDLRTLVCLYLNRQGLLTASANNGQQGLELVMQQQPGCVLMDIDMPVMDGLSALQALKGQTTTADIPVIMFTASRHPDYILDCKESGAFAFVPKGLEEASLNLIAEKVQEALRR